MPCSIVVNAVHLHVCLNCVPHQKSGRLPSFVFFPALFDGLLGFFLAWTTERVLVDPRWRWLVAIGFCGSYTTFSSYAFETMAYFEQGNWGLFAANIFANNLLCLGAVLAGAAAARAI